jgi:hypothetical protein
LFFTNTKGKGGEEFLNLGYQYTSVSVPVLLGASAAHATCPALASLGTLALETPTWRIYSTCGTLHAVCSTRLTIAIQLWRTGDGVINSDMCQSSPSLETYDIRLILLVPARRTCDTGDTRCAVYLTRPILETAEDGTRDSLMCRIFTAPSQRSEDGSSCDHSYADAVHIETRRISNSKVRRTTHIA